MRYTAGTQNPVIIPESGTGLPLIDNGKVGEKADTLIASPTLTQQQRDERDLLDLLMMNVI